MAVSFIFHIFFVAFGIGLPGAMSFAEFRANRTGDQVWIALARKWAKGFAILFAVGAVSGTILSISLPLFWPRMMGKWGALFGFPFMLEAFCFFLEAIFLGIYLYGWDRLAPWPHWWAGVAISASGLLASVFVMAANGWMQTPVGFTLTSSGALADVSPWRAILNPSMPFEAVHMIFAAYMVMGFSLASIYARRLLRDRADRYARRGMAVGLVIGLAFAPLQVVAGDRLAVQVARDQPAKLAAMEGLWKTQARAPETIGGIVVASRQETVGGIHIPGLLSLLVHGHVNATVKGLDAFPSSDRPADLNLVHVPFDLMVAIGFGLVGLGLWTLIAGWRRRRLPDGKWFLRAVMVSAPAALVALESGWMVTEIGRQPWIVYNYMRTIDAATSRTGIWVWLAVIVGVYLVLAVSTGWLLTRLADRQRGVTMSSEAAP
jgi:cytochrome d ubiquinol oxidase subunit I